MNPRIAILQTAALDPLATLPCVKRDNLAGTTGLEPAATGVTDRHDNQLHHVPFSIIDILSKKDYFVQSDYSFCTLLSSLASGSGCALSGTSFSDSAISSSSFVNSSILTLSFINFATFFLNSSQAISSNI